jgi:hypothetical protein
LRLFVDRVYPNTISEGGIAMRTKFLAIASTLLMVAGLVSLGAGPASAGNDGNTNGIGYWADTYGTTCIKYEAGVASTYGAVTDEDNVTLNSSATWQYLIVKGAAVDSGDGMGNAIYTLPKAGTPYPAPLTKSGQQAGVSHWILCGEMTRDASASATPTPATCQAAGGVTFAISHAKWENNTDLTDGSRNAIADSGHAFSDGTTTLAVTYTIQPKLDGQNCLPSVKYATPTQPTAEAGTAICIAGVSTGVNGTVTLSPFEHGHWVEGSGTLTDVAPGEHTFTAVADGGYVLAARDGVEPGSAIWIVTVPASTPIDCSTPPATLVTSPTYTAGSCQSAGTLYYPDTDAYTWELTGPTSARVLTATHTAGFTLTGQTVFGPYDLTQTAWSDAVCQPKFTVEQSCGYVKITYANNSKWDRWPDYHFAGDGVAAKDAGSGPYYTPVKVPAGQTAVIFEHTFAEDSGDIPVSYQDILGAERDIDTSVQTVVVDSDCLAPVPAPLVVTPSDPVALNEICVAGNRTSGSIRVDLKDRVAYTIDGTAVTMATTPVKPGDHVVTATALEGYVLEGDTVWPYTVTVNRAENCGFEFPTESVVTPTVVSNNITCTANGSFTLGEADGIADAIVWKVDGNLVTAGAHTVTKKGTHTVTAVPGDGHGFAEGIDNPSTWTLSFTDPTDCGDLATLALPGETLAATGADGGAVNLGLLLAGGLLFLGGALVITEKRFRFGKK